jgi:nucleoside-diphosphate-sugar epimerase
MNNQKILITGGAGYVGSLLSERLSKAGNKVVIFDTCYYGDSHIVENENLKLYKGDIRDSLAFEKAVEGIDAVIHLACISNDPSFALNENLCKTINFDCFEDLVKISKKQNVKKFIYASSSSVYGFSDSDNVTEEHPLVPLTLYNKFKGMCEPILEKYLDSKFIGVTIRPATLCGYAPRCRLDLSVNILTNHAVNRKKILVLGGGEQKRPNLDIRDMCRAYEAILAADEKLINNQIFNVSCGNKKIIELAEMVKKNVENYFNISDIEIEVKSETADKRSYHVNSDKIKNVLGFEAQYSVDDAILSLCEAFKLGKLPNSLTDSSYINVDTLKKNTVL